MGCGASSSGKDALDVALDENYGMRPSKEDDRPSKMGRKGKLQMESLQNERNSPATLGKKKIQNSFVIQKQRNKNRERDFGHIKNYAENDEFVDDTTSFNLPAENAVASDDMQVSRSAPSMKMPKAGRAAKSRFAPKSAAAIANQELALRAGDGADAEEASVSADHGEASAPPAAEHTSEDYIRMLHSDNMEEVLAGVTYFREKLSMLDPPVAEVRADGIVPRLVELMGLDSERKLQYEVVWTLTNVCSAEHEDCQEVVDTGAVPRFVALLNSCDDDDDVLEQAIWAMGNIAADSVELQKVVLDAGVVPPLMAVMETHIGSSLSILRHAAWLLSNLCRPRPQSDDLYDIIPTIKLVLSECDDVEVCTHTLWSLAYISGDEEALDDVLQLEEVIPKMVSWVSGANSSMTTPSLRILGNLCSGSPESTQMVVAMGGVQAIMSCLKASSRESVKKECVWSLSNIAAGTSPQVSALAKSNVFSEVVALLQSADESLQRECAYVLANPWAASVKVTPPVVEAMLKQEVVQGLAWLLANSSNHALLIVALEGLTDAVKRGKLLALNAKATTTADDSEDASLAPEDVPNPVVAILAKAALGGKLEELQGVEDEALQIKLRSFRAAADL